MEKAYLINTCYFSLFLELMLTQVTASATGTPDDFDHTASLSPVSKLYSTLRMDVMSPLISC